MVKVDGRPKTGLDAVNHTASPERNIIEVSVTMKAGICRRGTASPLAAPTTAPSASMIRTAAGMAMGLPPSHPWSALMGRAEGNQVAQPFAAGKHGEDPAVVFGDVRAVQLVR